MLLKNYLQSESKVLFPHLPFGLFVLIFIDLPYHTVFTNHFLLQLHFLYHCNLFSHGLLVFVLCFVWIKTQGLALAIPPIAT